MKWHRKLLSTRNSISMPWSASLILSLVVSRTDILSLPICCSLPGSHHLLWGTERAFGSVHERRGRDRDSFWTLTHEGGGRVEEGFAEMNGDGKTLGLVKHNTIYRWYIIELYTPETYMILLTNVSPIHSIKTKKNIALASVAQLVGVPSHNWKFAGLIPGQGMCLGSMFDPLLGHVGGSQLIFLSHIDVSLSPFLTL